MGCLNEIILESGVAAASNEKLYHTAQDILLFGWRCARFLKESVRESSSHATHITHIFTRLENSLAFCTLALL